MTATYVAWNGESYPWPPPNGWYEASDGLWWAAGTGPNPPESGPRRGPPDPPRPDGTDAGSEDPVGGANAAAEMDSPTSRTVGPSGGDRRRTPLLAGGTAAVALLVVLLLFLTLRDSDSDSPASPPPDTPVPSTTSTSADTTAASTSTSLAESTTTTISDQEKVTLFRARLTESDLSGDQLTDADIIEFGTAFCVFAAIATDGEEFDAFRQQAILDSDGELTDDEMTVAIDTSIVLFCPSDAERLGIGA